MSIALVDCNNFFVSCERIFNPSLRSKPVLVVSGNGGCVVARSKEVKELGIKVGEPLFKIKDIVKLHNIEVYNANFELYTDISRRVMSILYEYSYDVEITSIDEGYLDFNQFQIDTHTLRAHNIKNTILKWVGIPVSVGIGDNRTQAKVATHIAKKESQFNGVCNLNELEYSQIEEYFKRFEVGDIWGIGRQSAMKLNLLGVRTMYDFISLDEKWVFKNFDKPLYITYKEMKGEKVDNMLSHYVNDRKSVSMSRSFNNNINNYLLKK